MHIRLLALAALAGLVLGANAQEAPWMGRLRVGWSAYDQGNFADAEAILRTAVREAEASPGTDDRLPLSRKSLAQFYLQRNRPGEAVPLLLRALPELEALRGIDHPDVGGMLSSLGLAYRNSGKPAEAEQVLLRSEHIFATARPDDPDTALAQENLARLTESLGRREEAAVWYEKALATRERAHGPKHAAVAETAFQLASVLRHLGKFEQAEALYRRALTLREELHGPTHPDTLAASVDLGGLFIQTGRLADADAHYGVARKAIEERLGPDHPTTALILVNIGALRRQQARLEEAEQLLRRALAIFDSNGHPDPDAEALAWNNLGAVCWNSKRLEQAAQHYQRALTMLEALRGPDAPIVASVLEDYAGVMRDLGHAVESKALLERVAAIRAKRRVE